MTALSFNVTAWSAWLPEGDGEVGWRPPGFGQSSIYSANFRSSSGAAPALLRRRISPLGQRALRAAWDLDEAREARFVFASRHGEFGRTLGILNALTDETEVSPAEFSLSVHHALAGLLSIAHKNPAGHTTVAAGYESLTSGMLEAALCLAEVPAQPVILVYYDEPLPPPYDEFGEADEESIALVFVLTHRSGAPGLRLSFQESRPGTPIEVRPGSRMMSFLTSDAQQVTIAGDRLEWRLEKLDARA